MWESPTPACNIIALYQEVELEPGKPYNQRRSDGNLDRADKFPGIIVVRPFHRNSPTKRLSVAAPARSRSCSTPPGKLERTEPLKPAKHLLGKFVDWV